LARHINDRGLVNGNPFGNHANSYSTGFSGKSLIEARP
jgi:hypothetical protein